MVSTSSGKGLLPDGTKPLSEPVLRYHTRDPLAFTLRNVYWNTQDIIPQVVFEMHLFEITLESVRGQWANIYTGLPTELVADWNYPPKLDSKTIIGAKDRRFVQASER